MLGVGGQGGCVEQLGNGGVEMDEFQQEVLSLSDVIAHMFSMFLCKGRRTVET